MKDEIENAVKALVAKAITASAHHEAMQYAQAALNVAHTFATLEGTKAIKTA